MRWWGNGDKVFIRKGDSKFRMGVLVVFVLEKGFVVDLLYCKVKSLRDVFMKHLTTITAILPSA
jgi:hypothetical protein